MDPAISGTGLPAYPGQAGRPVLLTGASGFLGWHVAHLLLERGYTVRALVRAGSSLDNLKVERVTGDLRDAESLERAVEDCKLVFHVAADYRLWAKDPSELYRSNVDGTRNLLAAAQRAGVERVVYTSTVGCIGIPHNGIGDEDTPVTLDDMTGDYKRSKFMAEQVALEFARGGLPVVIVNPTAPIGSHDVKPTPTGKIVADFLSGAMPAFIDTGLNVLDVRDAAEGHLARVRSRPPGRTLHSGLGKPDAGTNSAKAGENHRPQSADYAAALCGCILRGRLQHRLGRADRRAAARAAGRRPHGEKENVGHARKGSARARFQPWTRGSSIGARRRVVQSCPLPGAMRLLFIAADRMEFPGILIACGPAQARSRCAWTGRAPRGSATNEILLVANGIGTQLRAAAAVDAAAPAFHPDAVVSTGFCGALSPSLEIADLVVATGIAANDRNYAALSFGGRSYRTSSVRSMHVAQTARRSGNCLTGAIAVEMEAAGVARAAKIWACRSTACGPLPISRAKT